jgi:kynurenine formamidase
MRIRSFIIAYALVLAILLFADRRPTPISQDRYSHVVDLTGVQSVASNDGAGDAAQGAHHSSVLRAIAKDSTVPSESPTRIVAPDALIPGTWTAGQIPAERLIAALVVMDLKAPAGSQISLDDIADWESKHGTVPQGAVVAIRRPPATSRQPPPTSPPITAQAAQFLMDARYTTGFAIETAVDFTADRTLARQIALHGNYVVESASHLSALPATGSLIVVAPAKDKRSGRTPVRVLAMVK